MSYCESSALIVGGHHVSSSPRIRRNTAESAPGAAAAAAASSSSSAPLVVAGDGNAKVNASATTKTTMMMAIAGNASSSELWKLVCLNMMVCGIEICASAGFTYLPPMMLKSGFAETSMTFAMGIGPFLALLAVPFLGRWSDHCRSRLGRRKPFLIGIALVMMVSLILIAHGHKISRFFAPGDAHLQAVLLVFGVILLDFGCHAGFNPCEALVADVMKHSADDEIGFTVYSTMISIGGCIGYIITAVDWSAIGFFESVDYEDVIIADGPDGQDQMAFSVITILFLVTVLTTVLVAKVDRTDLKSVEDLQKQQTLDETLYSSYRNGGSSDNVSNASSNSSTTSVTDLASVYSTIYMDYGTSTTSSAATDSSSEDVGYETSSNEFAPSSSSSSMPSKRTIGGASASSSSSSRHFPDANEHLQATNSGVCSGALKTLVICKSTTTPSCRSFRSALRLLFFTALRCNRDWPFFVLRLPARALAQLAALRGHVKSRLDVPLVLRRLFLADFCSWTALMCHNMFYSDYVGQAVYGGSPHAAANDALGRRLYDDGVRMGSWGLLLHSIASIVYVNTLQNTLIRTYGLQRTYFIGLAIFAISMTLTLATDNLALINLLAALSGTGFAVITTIPNMLITAYHADKATFYGGDFGRKSNSLVVSNNCDVHHEAAEDDDEEEDRGIASDFSILDSAYFLSQIVLSLSVGTIVDFTHSVSSYIVISAVFAYLACYLSTRVIFPKESLSLAVYVR